MVFMDVLGLDREIFWRRLHMKVKNLKIQVVLSY